MKNEDCKGCTLSRYNNETYCTYYLMDKTAECPCLTCLVKVTCDRLCDKRRLIKGLPVAEVVLIERSHLDAC